MACLFSAYTNKRSFTLRLVVDLICIALMAAAYLAVNLGAEPYHRGFFCDDESIKHPVQSDTISVPVALAVGLLIPVFTIIIVEVVLRRENQLCIASKKYLTSTPSKGSWIISAYSYIVVFIFGMGITVFITEVGKVSVGRLRPHFLTLCAPDFSTLDCTKGYITDDVCTSTDRAKLREARLSFPSGHSSFAMYSMLYTMLYIQARMSCKPAILIKPLILLALFSMGFYTCLSRISDYMHHWSDVLAGALLGMVVCFCVMRSLTDIGSNLCGSSPRDLITSRNAEHLADRKNSRTVTSNLDLAHSSNSVNESLDSHHVVNMSNVAY